MKQTDLYIPKAIASYALTNRCVSELRLYTYLKMSCSGKLRVTKQYVAQACNKLNIHRSTFYRLLRWLKDRRWVSKSQRSGYYFIIGFGRLLKKENLKGNTTALFSSKWFDSFKAFLSGVVIGYLCKHQRKAERKKGRSNKPRPVATKALASILQLPESTAYQLKKKAAQHRFITKKRAFKDMGIPSTHINQFRKTHPEIAYKCVSRKGKVQMCRPDKCKGLLKYKTKRQ